MIFSAHAANLFKSIWFHLNLAQTASEKEAELARLRRIKTDLICNPVRSAVTRWLSLTSGTSYQFVLSSVSNPLGRE